MGIFLGHIRLKPRPPLCMLPDLTKPTGTKKNEAVQWFCPSNGSVVLNTPVASNTTQGGEWFLCLYSSFVWSCITWILHAVLVYKNTVCSARHRHHKTACCLLNSAQSTEMDREQGIQEGWYKLLQHRRNMIELDKQETTNNMTQSNSSNCICLYGEAWLLLGCGATLYMSGEIKLLLKK